ncbi:TIR-NBS-LRR resistance protein, partial [Trifolium medium]|nr:TIR-NBS-LRR resistance protein [Trifolium medium]
RGRQGNKPYNCPQSNRGSNRSANQGTRGNPDGEKGPCFKCGQEGHFANNCRNLEVICFNCQKPGHFSRDCKAPNAEPSVNVTQGARPVTP